MPDLFCTMYLRQASALAAASRRATTAGSVRRLATGKDVKFGVDGRALMLQGVDKLADAVQVRGTKLSACCANRKCYLLLFCFPWVFLCWVCLFSMPEME